MRKRDFAAVVPEKSSRLQVKLGNMNQSLQIVGTTPNFPFRSIGYNTGGRQQLFTLAD